MQPMKCNPVWPEVQDALRRRVPADGYSVWLEPLDVKETLDKGKRQITITAENQHKLKWVVSEYGSLIEELFAQAINKEGRCKINFFFTARWSRHGAKVDSVVKASPKINKSISIYTSYIDPQNNFSTFITCESNLLAKQLALEVVQGWNKFRGGNSLEEGASFICGPSGLGKTHLLHAIANNLNKHDKQLNIMYVTADHFVASMVKSLRQKTIDKMKDAYCSADLLLVDDVHFFSGKNKTQDEFLNIFNILNEKRKQVVLSSDRPPQTMSGIRNQLKTRLSRCLITPIDRPDLQARIAIIKANARKYKAEIDNECAQYIAERIDRSVRDLEGAVKMVLFYAATHKKAATLELVIQALKDIILPPVTKIDMRSIIQEVASHCGITVADIKSDKRQSSITLCRQLAMFLCRELTLHSTTEIGLEFGGKNHSTVLYSCSIFDKKLKSNPAGEAADAYRSVKSKLTGDVKV